MKTKGNAESGLRERIIELEGLIQQTDVLFSIAKAGIKSTNLQDLLNLIVEHIAQGTFADRVSMITINQSERKINHFVRGGSGFHHIDLAVSYDELMDGLSGWAIQNKQSALSPKNEPDPRESPAVQQRRRETNCGSIIVTPVQYRGEILGTITVINGSKDQDFTRRDVLLIEAAAGQAAVAIIKANLYQELEKANHSLREYAVELEEEIKERKQVETQLRSSEEKLRQLIELTPDALVITDKNGGITITNNLCQLMFGYSQDELLGQSVEILIPDRFRKTHIHHRQHYYQSPQIRPMGLGTNMELVGVRKDGTEFPVEIGLNLLESEAGISVIAAIRDITERKQTETEFIHRASQLTALNQLSRNIVSTFNLDEIYVFAHQTVEQLMPVDAFFISLVNEQEKTIDDVYLTDLGKQYPNEQIFLSTPSITTQVVNTGQSLLIEDDASGMSKEIGTTVYGSGKDTRSILIVPLIRKDKVIGVISAQHYQPNMYTSTHIQLLELLANQVAIAILNARLHAALQQEAIQDPLTGLFNRRFMEESLEKEILRAKRNNKSIVVGILDIDHFKQVNDRYGHDAGDVVLRLFANLLKEKIRSGDIACRYGGEEFALILPDVSTEHAFQIMEKLRQNTNRLPFRYKEKTMIPLTCSIGIAVYPTHGTTSEILIKAADEALYFAKEHGRNQVAEAK